MDESGRPDQYILGDTHLIIRLIKNGFDNASRFATSEIHIGLESVSGMVRLTINDDGKGLDPESLASFAQRRERRKQRDDGKHFSLGLGSVIMKAIASVHGGSVKIKNRVKDSKIIGASLIVDLPSTPL